jgi:serine/threonine protein kinase
VDDEAEVDAAHADADVESTGTTMDAAGDDATPHLPASGELVPGQRLGRYIIVDVLGAGAMGMVYRAADPELSRNVAIKILRRKKRSGADVSSGHFSQRLRAEAQAMAKLNHPNVIAIHDVGSVGDDVFIAMELVPGQTMDRWLSRQHTVNEILGAFIDAAHGLAAAHAAGVVHRDFKPSNIMIGDDGRVRVLDFGVARPTSELSVGDSASSENEPPRRGGFAGTPSYMAPEQATSNQHSPASDQFAFCVSLYEALWGKRPFPPRRVAD